MTGSKLVKAKSLCTLVKLFYLDVAVTYYTGVRGAPRQIFVCEILFYVFVKILAAVYDVQRDSKLVCRFFG